MDGMYTSLSRPFYQAETLMNLAPLPQDKYTAFVQEKLKEAGKHIDTEVVSILHSRFDAVTSYMHRILNVLFSRTEKGDVCKTEMVDDAIDYKLRLSSDTYESLLYQMLNKQRQLFFGNSA